jgi:hypothetical protein
MERNESVEYQLVKEIMREERGKMASTIVFPVMLANATYKRLDTGLKAPHLVQ